MNNDLSNNFFIFTSKMSLQKEIVASLDEHHKRVDKLMFNLILIHWAFAALVFPFLFSNFQLGFIGGGLITLSCYLVYREFRGTNISRFVFTLSLYLFTAIFIQQSLGKIEAHFHVWVVLGILLSYKDIRPLFWVTAIILLHHSSLNICQEYALTIAGTPIVIYDSGSGWFTTFLHAFFVLPSTIIYARMGSISIIDFIKIEESKLSLESQIEETNKATVQILEQNQVLMDMSTPVTQLWDGILVLPLVGIIDSKRAQDIMSSMIEKIEAKETKAFILDISGIAIMDTGVANYIIKITKTTRLMGCHAIISGVSGAVANTMVQLGISIDEVDTTGNMQDALRKALALTDAKIVSIHNDYVRYQ